MNFYDFTLQRNMIVDDFPDPFRYKFWHWFLITFGIDLGSLFKMFFHGFSYFFDIEFCIDFLKLFGSKMLPNRPWRSRRLWDALWSPFGSLLAPCSSMLVTFGSILLSFGSILIPSGSAGSLLQPFSLYFRRFSYLILKVSCRFFCIWIACGSIFGRAPTANTILGHPTQKPTAKLFENLNRTNPNFTRPGAEMLP